MSAKRKIVMVVLYAVVAAAFDLISGYFVAETGLSICYPPAGLYMAVIMLMGWRALPLAFLSPMFSFVVTFQNQAVPMHAALAISASSLISPSIILVAVRHLDKDGAGMFTSLRSVVLYIVAVLLGVAVESCAAASAYTMARLADGGSFWDYASGWWISVVLPCVTLTPVLLLSIRRRNIVGLDASICRLGMCGFAAVVTMYALFMLRRDGCDNCTPRLYIGFLPVLWGAIAAGTVGGAHTSLLTVVTVLFLSAHVMGAAPLVFESQMFLLVVSITGLVVGAVVSERKKSEYALRDGTAELASLFAAAPVNFVLVQGRTFVKVNNRFCQLVGYAEEDLLGNSARFLYETDEEFERVGRDLIGPLDVLPQTSTETRFVRKDGITVEVWVSAAPLFPGNIAAGVTTVIFDISERKTIEDHLRRAQKMEAIGTLAGGIAHDFNNILAAMFGFVELARMDMGDPKELTTDLDQVHKGLTRAKDLVQQILTFSHGATEGKHPVQIAVIVKEAAKLLRATLPTSIDLRVAVASEAYVEADPTQIHQIMLNLCTNACHAMEEKGGVLGVSLTDIVCSDGDTTTTGVAAGRCVQLEVSDTGHGMEERVKARIFDPYFTTKDVGKGTGLGLAVVHGIVGNHNGHINVESEPGVGTTFRIVFPALDSHVVRPAVPEPDVAGLGGSEHILFVDDEESIVQFAAKVLPRYGYKVTICRNGMKALHTFAQNPRQFDLVFTDMTMPRMNGLELVRNIRATRPIIPVIICSGYTEAINEEKAVAEGLAFLQKPLRINVLIEAIRNELDKARP